MTKELIRFNFTDERDSRQLFVFEWNGKTAVIAPELMAFEGYKNVRQSWTDVKEREGFEDEYEYHSLKADELKEFKAIIKSVDDLSLVAGENYTTLYDQYKSVPSLDIVFEEGIYGVMYSSGSGHAVEFKRWMRREVNPQITQTGVYNAIDNKIQLIEDEKEKELTLKLHGLANVIKTSPNDMLLMVMYNTTKQELDTYISQREINKVKDEVKEFAEIAQVASEKIDKTVTQIGKATAFREGDRDAYAIATYFQVYSITNKPHNKFAEKLASVMGIYRNPKGLAGYQDDFISISLISKGGTMVSDIRYSELAFEKMKEYVETNGLKVVEPAKYIKTGKRKGSFDKAEMVFDDGEHIFVNENTYRRFSLMSHENAEGLLE